MLITVAIWLIHSASNWWWQLDYWSYKSCIKSSPPTNQHPVLLQAGCTSCRPTNSVKALKTVKLKPILRSMRNDTNLQLWYFVDPGIIGDSSNHHGGLVLTTRFLHHTRLITHTHWNWTEESPHTMKLIQVQLEWHSVLHIPPPRLLILPNCSCETNASNTCPPLQNMASSDDSDLIITPTLTYQNLIITLRTVSSTVCYLFFVFWFHFICTFINTYTRQKTCWLMWLNGRHRIVPIVWCLRLTSLQTAEQTVKAGS